jgi:hypothetical protein
MGRRVRAAQARKCAGAKRRRDFYAVTERLSLDEGKNILARLLMMRHRKAVQRTSMATRHHVLDDLRAERAER